MNCGICGLVLTSEELNKKIKCDQCQGCLCQGCSGLNATEIRVMQLTGGRTLKLICRSCDQPGGSALSQGSFQLEIGRLEESLKDHYGSLVSSLQAEFSAAIRGVVELVTHLRESNIQLVHFLNPSISGNCASGVGGSAVPLVEMKDSLVVDAGDPSEGRPAEDGAPLPGVSETGAGGVSYSSVVASDTNRKRNSIGRAGSRDASAVLGAGRGIAGAARARQHQRNSYIVGAKTSQASAISAAKLVKKTSIAVSRLSLETTVSDLEVYLRSTFGVGEEFTIEKMTVRSNNYTCFRIETRLELLESLLDPQNWPEGSRVKRFRFFRSSHSNKGASGSS